MEAERRKNRSTAPFSDLTNTPIIDLSSAKPQFAKTYYSSFKSNTKSVNPSKFDSIIGSSNIKNAPIPNNREGLEPLVIYSRAQTAKKIKKSKRMILLCPTRTLVLRKQGGKEKDVSSALAYTLVEKAKDKGKSILLPFSSFSSVRMKAKGKAIAPGYHNLEEIEERGAAIVLEAQSCPPQKSRRNSWGQFNEALDSLQPKLHTDPRPTKKKRLWSSQEDEPVDLPQDFVEQQRAYFKEVDDFELLEEEVSDVCLDEEENPNSYNK